MWRGFAASTVFLTRPRRQKTELGTMRKPNESQESELIVQANSGDPRKVFYCTKIFERQFYVLGVLIIDGFRIGEKRGKSRRTFWRCGMEWSSDSFSCVAVAV